MMSSNRTIFAMTFLLIDAAISLLVPSQHVKILNQFCQFHCRCATTMISSMKPLPLNSSSNLGLYSCITTAVSLSKGDKWNSKVSDKDVIGKHSAPLSKDRILPPGYFKSVYELDSIGDEGVELTSYPTSTNIPWDLGDGRPQPEIVRAFKEGKLKGRIIDAGCGMGENCMFLAQKGSHGGVTSIVGFDLAPGAINIAKRKVLECELDMGICTEQEETQDLVERKKNKFWTRPEFLVASCTEIADEYNNYAIQMRDKDNSNPTSEDEFDVMIDSGLLHCLSDEDAELYVSQMARLLKPGSGRAYVGCFSTKNPDPWDNPRRLNEEFLRKLFSPQNGWEVISVKETWWARPPSRGTSQGAFSMALWMEARRCEAHL